MQINQVLLTTEHDFYFIVHMQTHPEHVIQYLIHFNILRQPNCNQCQRQCTLKRPLATSGYSDVFCWECVQCRNEYAIGYGSYIHGHHLPMFEHFHMLQLFYWTKAVKSAAAYSRISTKTIGRHYRFYRRCISHWIQTRYYNRFQFPRMFAVQWDESALGRRLHHRGRYRVPSWILGGIQHENGLCVMHYVPRRNAATLIPIIVQHTHYQQMCVTDSCAAYRESSENIRVP